MTEVSQESSAAQPPHRWQPIGAIDRRVLGVLAEKAKTTPDIYPMSLNAICTGCNQKSNRSPLMQLELDQVEESLDRLRQIGAVGLVEGYGRVQKYRHYLYEWLGVDKVEMAVITELMLRGDQTVGELRGRASRMEPISDLAALGQVLDSLKQKGLVVALTPEGRGHVVTHALYKPRELETLQAKYEAAAGAYASRTESIDPAPINIGHSAVEMPVQDDLRRELDALKDRITQLQSDFEELQTAHQRLSEELLSLKDALGG